jgi:hypothetical protein
LSAVRGGFLKKADFFCGNLLAPTRLDTRGVIGSSQTFTSRVGAAVLCRSATTAVAAFWRYGAAFFSSVGPAVCRKGTGVTYSTARKFLLHGSKTEGFNKMRQIKRGREERGKYGRRRG